MAVASGGQGVRSEINITPLVDVVLVLLIIFMVSASFMGAQRALSVNLPSARAAEPVKEKQNVNVVVSADEGTKHGQVVHVIDIAKQQGVTKFAINVMNQ